MRKPPLSHQKISLKSRKKSPSEPGDKGNDLPPDKLHEHMAPFLGVPGGNSSIYPGVLSAEIRERARAHEPFAKMRSRVLRTSTSESAVGAGRGGGGGRGGGPTLYRAAATLSESQEEASSPCASR